MKLIALLSCCLVVQLTVGQIAEAAKKKSGCKGEDDRNATNYDDFPCGLVQVPLNEKPGKTHQSSARQLPYLAKIIFDSSTKLTCGGAILSKRQILTVRGCTRDIKYIAAGNFGDVGEQLVRVGSVKTDDNSGLAMITTTDDIWLDDDGLINCILPRAGKLPKDEEVLVAGLQQCIKSELEFPMYRWARAKLMDAKNVNKQPKMNPKWVDSNAAVVAEDTKQIIDYGMPMTKRLQNNKYELVGIAATMYNECKGFAYIQIAPHVQWIKSMLATHSPSGDAEDGPDSL